MLSFENTEIAFKIRSNKDLNRAYLLFKMISSNSLVYLGKKLSNAALKLHLPVDWAVKPTIYSHFVGGVTIDECRKNVRSLEKFGVKAILDYSVEGTESEEGINKAMEETLQTIHNAAQDRNVPFTVFKPTAFTKEIVLEKVSAGKELTREEKQEADNFRARVGKLCQTAFDNNVPILIDAEDTYFQNFIDEVVNANMEKFNKKSAIVFNTYQMYRWDRLEVLEKAYNRAVEKGYYLGAKFVRGAYMERERARAAAMGYKDPIQPDKDSTDRDYNAALKFCIEHIDRISIFNGTHNEYSSLYMTELMEKHNIPKNDPRCWFSQLYGMSDHISFNLAHAGYNVAKYVPFGPVRSVLPYLIRRTEENTSIAGQTSRELNLIIKERERRKAAR
ncbi:MAG: proline dehydrogenase family protein [Bacteroidales bacterium]|nr:proline dehydrogenase family protein [Bacteroidales bacterium]